VRFTHHTDEESKIKKCDKTTNGDAVRAAPAGDEGGVSVDSQKRTIDETAQERRAIVFRRTGKLHVIIFGKYYS
jgi:hypothetical protein